MNFISKNFNEKNLLLLISFFLIIFIFINFTHKHFESFTIKDDNSYSRLTNIEFKNNINKNLTSDPVYETILTKKCEITGNMHDRHKVRWIKFLLLKNIFQVSEKLNSNYISQLGWQWETRFTDDSLNFALLGEWVLMAGGFEKNMILPLISGIVGFRSQKGFESGIGAIYQLLVLHPLQINRLYLRLQIYSQAHMGLYRR